MNGQVTAVLLMDGWHKVENGTYHLHAEHSDPDLRAFRFVSHDAPGQIIVVKARHIYAVRMLA